MSVNHSGRSGGIIGIYFRFSLIRRYVVWFSLESPHQGNSYEYIQYTIFNIKKKMTLNYPKSAAMDFVQGTQERVRNSRGKRAISVRATEVLLYFYSFTFLPFILLV